MLIRQIIITIGIPFEVKMNHFVYSAEVAVNEVGRQWYLRTWSWRKRMFGCCVFIKMERFPKMNYAGEFWKAQIESGTTHADC